MLGYACLVAIMSMGQGYHRVSRAAPAQRALGQRRPAPVVTSAGALVEGLQAHGRQAYLGGVALHEAADEDWSSTTSTSEGFEVLDYVALEIPDNLEVGRHDPRPGCSRSTSGWTAAASTRIVLSACVQMPSLASIQKVQHESGIPTVSAAVATTWQMLRRLELRTEVAGCGALLSDQY